MYGCNPATELIKTIFPLLFDFSCSITILVIKNEPLKFVLIVLSQSSIVVSDIFLKIPIPALLINKSILSLFSNCEYILLIESDFEISAIIILHSPLLVSISSFVLMRFFSFLDIK